MGCCCLPAGPAGPRLVSPDPGASYGSSLEARARWTRSPDADWSNELRREPASHHAQWKPSRPSLSTISFDGGQTAVAVPHAFANPIAVTEGSCDLSSPTSGSNPTSTGSLRRSNGSRSNGSLRGRNLELQQDSQRHMLGTWRRALVDWKSWASRPWGTLANSDVRDDLTATLPTATSSVPLVVDTEGGPVTMLDLAGLRTRAQTLQQESATAAQQTKSMRELAEDLWVQAGRTLTARLGQSSPTPQVAALTQQAVALTAKAESDDSELQSIHDKQHGGFSGLAGKLGSWNESRKLSSDRLQVESQLRPLLAQIARLSPEAVEIVSIRSQAISADTQAQELKERTESLSMDASAASAELKRRTDAEREMGFDAPYTAAYLKTYGPPEVQSPLVLKRGERACMVAPATLARQQTRRQWVGGNQGFSFPIGHTGIRYRVGSFHGHPIQQQFLGKLDFGTLVISNQRIAFIGKVKSTSVPFAKLLHVECYADAVAVFQEGRENPDFYLTAQPKYALFMINWFLNQAAS